MPNLQRRCRVHSEHPVDTCQGAVNFLTGAEPLGDLWALCGSEVEEAAMSATVIPLLTYDKLYPLEEVVAVFTHENRGVSAQYATPATPTRSSHGPMGA